MGPLASSMSRVYRFRLEAITGALEAVDQMVGRACQVC